MLRKLIFALLIAFTIGACSSTTDDRIYLKPNVAMPYTDPTMRPIAVSITATDQRSNQAISETVKNHKVVALYSARDVQSIFNDVISQQLSARGYILDPQADIKVTISVDELFANVQQGDFRHLITTKSSVTVIANMPNGRQSSKTFNSTTTNEGALSASKLDITNSLETSLSSVISAMARDNSIHIFMKENSR